MRPYAGDRQNAQDMLFFSWIWQKLCINNSWVSNRLHYLYIFGIECNSSRESSQVYLHNIFTNEYGWRVISTKCRIEMNGRIKKCRKLSEHRPWSTTLLLKTHSEQTEFSSNELFSFLSHKAKWKSNSSTLKVFMCVPTYSFHSDVCLQ